MCAVGGAKTTARSYVAAIDGFSRKEATHLEVGGDVNGSVVQALQLLGNQRDPEGGVVAGGQDHLGENKRNRLSLGSQRCCARLTLLLTTAVLFTSHHFCALS